MNTPAAPQKARPVELNQWVEVLPIEALRVAADRLRELEARVCRAIHGYHQTTTTPQSMESK